MHIAKVKITYTRTSRYDDLAVTVTVNPHTGVKADDPRLAADEFMFAAEVLAVAKKYADDFATSDG